MKAPRRRFLHLAAGAALLPADSRITRADAYPSRPVRLIVYFPAGGVGDILARLMGQWLSERLGEPFVVENRPGASGNIGTQQSYAPPLTAIRCSGLHRQMRSTKPSMRTSTSISVATSCRLRPPSAYLT